MAVITPESLARSGTEHGHQTALFCWIAQTGKYEYPLLDRAFAIPNGGLRNKDTAARLKAEGVKSGVLDIFLPVPIYPYHGLFIEMKAPGKRTNTSGEQDQWIVNLMQSGYYVEVCDHWLQAVDVFRRYMVGNFNEYKRFAAQHVNGS